jgi:D-sedoheptulose 7-phosphate isomerase
MLISRFTCFCSLLENCKDSLRVTRTARGGCMTQSSNRESRISKSMQASVSSLQALLGDQRAVSTIATVCELLISALRAGNKIILFGNGGSAADAQHIAAELVGRFAFDRPALPALALTVNSSCLTAIGNDHGFKHIFARQIEALARPGDVVIAISTSGNSPNVICALESARNLKLKTVALTGESGGKLHSLVDHCICAPSQVTPRIQECHSLIGHILSEIVEQELFPDNERTSNC